MSVFAARVLPGCLLTGCLLVGLMLPGCGSEEKPSPKLKVAPAKGLQVAPPAPNRSAAPIVKIEKPRKDPTVDRELRHGEQLFAVLKEPNLTPDPQNLFTDNPAVTGGSVDLFAANVPAPGVTSASFVVTSGSEQAGSASIPTTVRFPAGFVPQPGFSGPPGPDGLPTLIRCLKDGSLMALVTAGTFTRGHDGGPADAGPAHRVGLDHFYIDVYEITAAQYDQYRESVRREKKSTPRAPERRPRDQNEPAMGLSWGEAIAYTRWAGKELPTEAQWEKAARGRENFDFPWGNGVHVWHRPRRPGQIDPVGSFPTDKSPFGVFDMAGNAREWCSDWYSATAYQDVARKGDAGGGVQNPPGPAGADPDKSRVVRGGDPQWRIWPRGHIPHVDRPVDVGFRCVLTFRPDRNPAGGSRTPSR